MNPTAYLTPAECLFLLKPGQSTLRTLLKNTLIDLVLKRVLSFSESTNEEGEPVVLLARGERFTNYTPEPHEEVLLTPFSNYPEARLDLQEFSKLLYQTVGSESRYKYRYLRKSQRISRYFSDGFFNNLFLLNRLNEQGKKFSKNLEQELQEWEQKLQDKSLSKEELEALLEKVGSKIILIPNLDARYLQKIKASLPAKRRQQPTREADGTEEQYYEESYSWGLMEYVLLFEVFDWVGNEVSSGFDQFGSEFDAIESAESSWGGDLGDGGCSGCGGCGD